MSTKLKFNLLFVCSLIIFGIIVEYYSILTFKKSFLNQRKISGQTILETVKNDLDFAVAISNYKILNKISDKILKINYINFLKIYKADKLIFSKIKNNNFSLLAEKIELLPPKDKPEVIKYIIGLNISDFKSAQQRFFENITITIILLIFLIYIIISISINKFLQPISHLIEAVRKLKSGEYKKINIKSSKEFHLLIDTYNNFVEALKAKDIQLQNKIDELNDKINEINALQKIIINAEKLASIGTMVAGMAHEINNPLSGIKGQAELMLYIDNVKDEKVRKVFYSIVENCDRIADIIKKLKGFSKLTNEKKYYKIRDIINDAIDILNQSKKVLEYVEFKGNYQSVNSEIFCNRNEVIQVFINLIENSFQACKGNCQITIDIFEDNDKIEILFKDNGAGIDENIKDNIFDPFFTTKKEDGTGLGLFICHKIIIENNGNIECVNSKEGACFKITFVK